MAKIYIIKKGTTERELLGTATYEIAMQIAESWGWSYDDGKYSYYMEVED